MSEQPSGPVFRELPADVPPVVPLTEKIRGAPLLEALALAARAVDERIVIPAEVRDAILSHVERSMDERGGILLGAVYALPASPSEYPFVTVVTSAVPAETLASGPVSLAMAGSVWRESWRGMDAGRRVVGWYHSHPDLGVFFSGIDRRTQREFFPVPYSVGLVVDWVRRRSALFTGAESNGYLNAAGDAVDPIFGRTSVSGGTAHLMKDAPQPATDFNVEESPTADAATSSEGIIS